MSDIPSIYEKFKLYVKSTGASFLGSDRLPLLESTELDYPWLRMLLRARDNNRLTGPANGFKSKIKWKVTEGYGPRKPGTPVKWERRGSMEQMSSHYCHEMGTLMFIEDEIKKQVGSIWSAESMAQQFDDVLENMKQDMYVDLATYINNTIQRVPDARMEDGTQNITRGIFAGMNEWKAGHGVHADGCFPGVTKIQNYDPKRPGAKMAAHVETYSKIGREDGLAEGHIFEAFMRGLRNVNFRAVPLAENYTEGTEGSAECFASIDGISLLSRTLAAHDNVLAEEGVNSVYSINTRIKGMELVDVPGLEHLPICPSYTASGAPNGTAAALHDASKEEQAYQTEKTSTNCAGARFYIPYQKDIRPIWDADNFMNESRIYGLEETTPDAMVMHIRNDRNLHFESFRRNLVIRPLKTIPA